MAKATLSNYEEIEYEVQIDELSIDDSALYSDDSELVEVDDLNQVEEVEELEVVEGVEDVEEYTTFTTAYNTPASYVSQSPLLASRSSVVYPDNMIVYEGVFNGSDRTLYIPVEFKDSVAIIDGYLYNVGNSNIYGRFDHLDGDTYVNDTYYLTPICGSTNVLYRYGSYNYQTHYFVGTSSTSLNQTNTYGDFTVTNIVSDKSSSYQNMIHFDLLAIFFILGVLTLCSHRFLKSSGKSQLRHKT